MSFKPLMRHKSQPLTLPDQTSTSVPSTFADAFCNNTQPHSNTGGARHPILQDQSRFFRALAYRGLVSNRLNNKLLDRRLGIHDSYDPLSNTTRGPAHALTRSPLHPCHPRLL